MANKGLKSYTKQISGNIGLISYNVNVYSDDSNLVLTIPLINLDEGNPVGLSLIYNYLGNNTSLFGLKNRNNFEYKLIKGSSTHKIINPDQTEDTFTQSGVISGSTSHPTFIYKSPTSELTLIRETISTSGQEKFHLEDKQGNKYYWNNNYVSINSNTNYDYITYIDKPTNQEIEYNPNSNEIINNYTNEGIIVLKNNNLITRLSKYNIDGNILDEIYITYDSLSRITNIKYYYLNTLEENYFFTYNTSYIEILDDKKDYRIRFNIESNKFKTIQEKYGDNELTTLYTLLYSYYETRITNKLGDKFYVKYNPNNLAYFEYDEKGNYKFRQYNSNNLVTFESNIINPNKLASYGNRLINPKINNSSSISTSTSAASTLGFTQKRTLSSIDSEYISEEYELAITGDINDPLTITFYRDSVCYSQNGEFIIELKLYNDDEIIDSYQVTRKSEDIDSFNKIELFGLFPKASYNKLIVKIILYKAQLIYSDIIVAKYNSGIYYEYDLNNNITQIRSGNNERVIGYSDNYIESEVVKGNKEKVIEYNGFNNPIRTVNNYGVETKYAYNVDNYVRLKTIKSETNGIKTINYSYSNNDLTEESDSSYNKINYYYDNYHRLTKTIEEKLKKETTYLNNKVSKIDVKTTLNTPISDIDYTYNNDNIKTITCENGSVYEFSYDEKERLINVKSNNIIILSLEYDDNDNIIKKNYNNNYYTFTYLDQLLSIIKYNNSNRYEISYDDYKRINKIKNCLLNIESSYEYDINDRVTKISDIESEIQYQYQDNDNDIIIKRNVDNYEIIEENNNLTLTNNTNSNKLRGLFNDNNKYVGSMCINDNNLRGNYQGNTYIYLSSLTKDALTIDNGISCVKLDNNTSLSYILQSPKNNYSGSIGMWIKIRKDNSNYTGKYTLFSRYNKNKTYKLELVYNNNSLILYLNNTSIRTLSNKSLNEYTFIALSFNIYEDNGYKLDYNIQYNAYNYSSTYSLSNNIELNDYNYYIGEAINDIDVYQTGIIMSLDEMLNISDLNDYYNITSFYLINDPEREFKGNGVDFLSSMEYQNLSGYELFPLHGSLLSLNGIKEKNIIIKNKSICDKQYFNYNYKNNRYCFECNGNLLEYNLGNNNCYTVSLNVYVHELKEGQIILEEYDNNGNRLILYIFSSGRLVYKIGNSINTTTLILTAKTWNRVSISYSHLSSNYYMCCIRCNNNQDSFTLNFSQALGDVNLVLGGSYTTNNPLIGQIEMLLVSNTYFLDNNNYNNIKNMFFMNKYSEIDDLGRLIKSGVKNKDNNIITNELEYQIINSTPTYNVSKEIIKYGNNTINRSYSYGSNNNKNNITNISDSIFGNKSYGYNYRGYLVDDNGISITYDSNGNILTYGSKSFIYDSIVKDKLIKVGNNSISYGSNTLLPSYYKDKNYIYEGNRLKRIIISGADETTFIDYYYDLNGLRIKKIINCEYNDDRDKEVEIIKYYYEGNRLITEYKDENKRLDFLYDNNGILYGFIENKTNIYYYVRDCMQNILGIIDSNNTIVVKYNYNAYGEILSITGNPYIGSINPFRYKGYYYDDETNLYYCNSRYYVAEWCRWLTPDSV